MLLEYHNIVGLPHLEATGGKRLILETTEKITYCFSNNLFCNSLNLKEIVSSMTTKNVKVIGNGSVNGVDVEYFKDILSKEEKDKIIKNLNLTNNNFCW